jgi:hypothetical protein
MKPFLTLTAAALSILTALTVLGATPPPLPVPLVSPEAQYRIFTDHMTHLNQMMKNVPPSAVKWSDLHEMYSMAAEMCAMLDALDPLCKAYPQTDTQWRTENFLPYVRDCSKTIEGYIKILAATEKSKVPREVRDEAQWLLLDLGTMDVWIMKLWSAAGTADKSAPSPSPTP